MTVQSFTIGPNDPSIRYINGIWSGNADSSSVESRFTNELFATASFEFDGIMATVSGTLDEPGASSLSPILRYVLDGKVDNSFLLNSTTLASNTLFSSPSLSPGRHTLLMTLINNTSTVFVRGMNITTDIAAYDDQGAAATAYRRRVGAIVGGTIGGVVLLVVIIISFILYRRRNRQTVSTPYALGPLKASLPSSKEAFTSRNYSNYGISFTTSAPPSTDSFTTLPRKSKSRSRLKGDTALPVRIPPPSK